MPDDIPSLTMQVGATFSCKGKGHAQQGTLWDRMLRSYSKQAGKAKAAARQAEIAAATRALHYHIGLEVGSLHPNPLSPVLPMNG